MNLNLSSQIVLNQVPEEFYNPKTAVDRSEITRNEKILTDIFPKVDEGAAAIANAIVKEIKDKQQLGKYCVLGLGTGQSLTPVYDELIRIHREQKVSFRNVVVFNAYEYFPLKADSAISSIHQLRERFLSKVDIPEQNVFSPDGSIAQDEVQQLCRLYEERIQSFGGIDIMLLGIGRIGNIATNEPGSGINTRSRLILIDATSREEMTMSFGGQEAVPPCSITLGIANILAARKIYLTAWGEEKADIIRQTVEGSVSEAFPASYLQTHNNCHVVVDLAAAGKLTRIIHPWLVANCKWTDKLTRAALVWLCGVTHKPILKLTNKDYNENGLSELLALYGSAYQCNIKIFNDLQHTITGWPGGKPNADDSTRPVPSSPFPKRVIVFSPHPDDDVISMGGTFIRLVQQGHDVHVAYETSGNVAVHDDVVLQNIDTARELGYGNHYAEVEKVIAGKRKGEPEPRPLLDLKGAIRRAEARAAVRSFGLNPDTNAHFLNLPFYETGGIKKGQLTEKDIEIIVKLLREIKPHQIYAAGDLADPHGTHRTCMEAVLGALEVVKDDEWLKECHLWLYRGAWMEWDLGMVDMAVPLSPDELIMKRHAIYRHLSQKDIMPFPGSDPREFWQRAEERTQNTAKLYDQLGMAEYQAIEVFVKMF